MPRYFFEVENEEALFEDSEGAVYADDEAAVKGAQRLADDLLEQGGEFIGAILTVFNEAHVKIAIFTIRPPNERLQ